VQPVLAPRHDRIQLLPWAWPDAARNERPPRSVRPVSPT